MRRETSEAQRKGADAKASSPQPRPSSGPDRQAESSVDSYYVTIVTSKKYTKEAYVSEATRLGVSRAIPLRILATLEDGEPIFVADWQSSEGKRAEVKITELEDGTRIIRRGESKVGTLIIFGYFYAENIAFISDMKTLKKLEEEGLIDNVKQDGTVERRGCGTMSFDISFKRQAPISQIANELDLLRREGCNIGKVFIRGRFVKLDEPIIISNVKYFRGYKKFPAPPLPEVEPLTTSFISKHIESYKYHKNKEAEVLEQLPID